jgi:L-ribulose-5-phosphate 4-epimerase
VLPTGLPVCLPLNQVVFRTMSLSPEKMVIVDFDGTTVDGTLRPSSDTKTHAVLYKHWDGIGGIVHTHSTYATAWAQAQRDIPISAPRTPIILRRIFLAPRRCRTL